MEIASFRILFSGISGSSFVPDDPASNSTGVPGMDVGGMAHGTVVQIQDLKSKPELNGLCTVILEPQTAKERVELEKAGRVKVAARPKTLALRPENVKCLGRKDLERIDWSFADIKLPGDKQFATATAAIKHPQSRCGHLHRCDEFADVLWRILASVDQPPRLQLDSERVEAILHEILPHCFHFFALDQIGHHLVIEKRAGRARVFQSYVKHTVQESGLKVGYSAREWVTGRPDKGTGGKKSQVNQRMLEARNRWGGDEPLDYQKLEMLMELIVQLQSCAGEIAEVMYQQLPEKLLEEDSSWRARMREQREAGALKEEPLGGIAKWSAAMLKQPGEMTIFSPPDGPHIICMAGGDFAFEIPCLLADTFSDLYQNLTGEKPFAPVYLKILHYRDWPRSFTMHQTGQPSAVGWSVCTATISH